MKNLKKSQEQCYAQFLKTFPDIASSTATEEVYKNDEITLRVKIVEPENKKYGFSIMTNAENPFDAHVPAIFQFYVKNNTVIVIWAQDATAGIMYNEKNDAYVSENNITELEATDLCRDILCRIAAADYKKE